MTDRQWVLERIRQMLGETKGWKLEPPYYVNYGDKRLRLDYKGNSPFLTIVIYANGESCSCKLTLRESIPLQFRIWWLKLRLKKKKNARNRRPVPKEIMNAVTFNGSREK